MKKPILFSLLYLLVSFATAQQTSSFFHWYAKPYLVNPAWVGTQVDIEAVTSYHKDWLGFVGSPETILLSIDGQLLPKGKKKLPSYPKAGFGGYLYNDVTHIFGKTGGALSYARRIQLSKTQYIGLGLNLGLVNHRLFLDRITADNEQEQTLLNSVENQTAFDGAVGISYKNKNLELGVASFQLFQNSVVFGSTPDQRELAIKLVRHFNVTAKYNYQFKNSAWAVHPLLFLQSASGLATQVQGGAIGYWKDKVWLGANYNSKKSVLAVMGARVNESIDVAYAYEHSFTNLNQISNGSHEIMVKFRLKSIARELRKLRETDSDLVDDVDSLIQQQFEKIDRLGQEKEVVQESLEKEKEKVKSQEEQIKELEALLKEEKKKTEDLVAKLKAASEKKYDQKEKVNEYHVIVGVLTSSEVAKQYQRMLLLKGKLSTTIVRHDEEETGVSRYLVSAGKFRSWDKAHSRSVALKKDRNLRTVLQANPWIYLK